MFNLSQTILELTIWLPPFLLALTCHELAHGYVAYALGDPTAKIAGRLTMNPIKHIDPMGALIFIVAKIGWAKPVPVNPNYFRNPRQGMLLVALAGPGANIALAIISAILFKTIAKLFIIPAFVLVPLVNMLYACVVINFILAAFNCLPIPPLDGSKVLMSLLPPDMAATYSKSGPIGMIVLLILCATDYISRFIDPIIVFSHNLLLG
ncbi:MAG: site-2 protease family protein [Desulfobulbus propionicus]|nr:MAG: site-2 protease family protein [Desulfobulbus propionicus]